MNRTLIRVFHLLPEAAQDRVRSALYSNERLLRRMTPRPSAGPLFAASPLMWIDPQKIVYWTEPAFDIRDRGRVVRGDWDRLNMRFGDYDFYKAAVRRFTQGTRWEDTEFYHRILKGGEYGSRREADRKCRAWDAAYESMRAEGYRAEKTQDPVCVNIGRHGDLLFNSGGHRLAIAKILGVESVLVEVTVRHEEWERFRGEIAGYAEQNGGRVYAPLTHLDLAHFPSTYGHERWEMIKKSLGEGLRSVLDIGAHWGYFCHRFEELGYDCTAVESSPTHLYFLQKLKRAENRRFLVQPISLLSLGRGKVRWKFDIVLALAVFHHFFKQGKAEELARTLEKLECREMYFQAHHESEPQAREVGMSPEGMVRWVIQNSCLEHGRTIGKCGDGREMWKLWRTG